MDENEALYRARLNAVADIECRLEDAATADEARQIVESFRRAMQSARGDLPR